MTRFQKESSGANRIQLEDAASALRQYMMNIPDAPERLGVIEDRVEFLGRLKKKYGGTLTGVLKTGESIREELEKMPREWKAASMDSVTCICFF